MGALIDAIDRLNQAIDEYEARQRAKECVSIAFGIVPAIIPGFPPLPVRSGWNPPDESGAHTLIDGMEYDPLMEWGATLSAWAQEQSA